MIDIPTKAFLELRNHFFDKKQKPISFFLRRKRNTQDDPLDEYIADNVLSNLGIMCKRSGPLVSPDIVLADQIDDPGAVEDDLSKVLAMEVKRIGRTKSGGIRRSSSIDYNSTPPCGMVRVYNDNNALDIRSFYLFACTESRGKTSVSSLVLADGNLLNDDFGFYLSVTGERKKKIGLGSYSDGINRARPMITFPNPLGVSELDHNATLIHQSDILAEENNLLKMTHIIERVKGDGTVSAFYCYRLASDVPANHKVVWLGDPFDIPESRTIKTKQRGKFNISL